MPLCWTLLSRNAQIIEVMVQALNLRHAVDAAGDARSGGAKPLPGPSYEQMDVAVGPLVDPMFELK